MTHGHMSHVLKTDSGRRWLVRDEPKKSGVAALVILEAWAWGGTILIPSWSYDTWRNLPEGPAGRKGPGFLFGAARRFSALREAQAGPLQKFCRAELDA